MCILSGQEDPIIFLQVMVDPTGVEGVKTFKIDRNEYTYIFKHKHIQDRIEDPIIFLQVMVDPTGVEGVK